MVVLTLGFATGYSAFSTNITLNAKGNIKEKSRIIRSWTSDSVDDFHNSQYRENIVSATFLDSTSLPSNVENSWDVSADGKGGVIAYVMINEEDHTKYDLYIGAKNGVIANENSSYLFQDFTNVEKIEFNNNFDTKNVLYMSFMFRSCMNLISLDLSSFDTSNVISMLYMFHRCKKLSFLDISSFNTSNVTNMQEMFAGGNKLTTLDLTNFNTSKVTNMQGMFTTWDNVTSSSQGNESIENIIFGEYFVTNKVTKMNDMFSGQLYNTLDLSNFDTSKVTTMFHMFNGCRNLKTIYVNNSFITSSVTNSDGMFMNDTNLIGGNGTLYSSSYIDKEYARIDTASTPGYFTLKQ